MSSVLVSGLIVGVLYALVGAGLVLVYRQARVLNFAHAAVGTLAAYIAYSLIEAGVPYVLAALIAIAAGAVSSMLIEFLVIRRLSATSEFGVAIATLGVGLIMLGFMTIQWGSAPLPLRDPVESKWTVEVIGVAIGATQLLSIGITIAVFAGLYVLIERTRFGLSMRAVSEGPVTAGMLGVNVPMVRIASWGIGGALAAIAGLLIVPQYQLEPQFLTAFMITAFAAVIVGGIESIAGAAIGGLVFGVGSSLLAFYITGRLTQTVSLVVILMVLAVAPYGLFGRRLHHVAEPAIGRTSAMKSFGRRLSGSGGRIPALPPAGRVVIAVVLVAALFLVPLFFTSNRVFEFALVAAIFPAVLGQNVVGGYGGQASIGQSGFMVVGGYLTAVIAANYDLPFLLVVVLSIIASAVVGLLLALSVARLSGVYLALITLSFALALPELAAFPVGTTGGADGLSLIPPEIFGVSLAEPTQIYTALLIAAIITGIGVWVAARGAAGRRWRAVRDSETGAASIGISVGREKVIIVAIGGALAGLGGALNVTAVGFIAPDSFTIWIAIYLLAAMIVGGSSSVLGAVIGAAFITLLPVYTASLPELPDIIFGLALLLALLFAPNGLASIFRSRRRGPVVVSQRDAPLPNSRVLEGADVAG
jgi:branched-chain amino acid transport system permease protein